MGKVTLVCATLLMAAGTVGAVVVQQKAAERLPAALGFDGGLTCVLNVKSMRSALAWYRDVLGFTLDYQIEDMGWCELKTPVTNVRIGLGQKPPVGQPGGATLTFGVTDIDHARAELERREVRFDGPTETIPGLVKLARFFDLDGNRLTLYQSLKKE